MSTGRIDYDFIGFTFDGKHSIRDLKIYRTSDGSRYNTNLVPTMNDKSADIPGNDGMYYFGTTHKQRQFNVNFAFDSLKEQDLRNLKILFSGKHICDLSFDETPYIVYSAKVTGTPQIKTICFDVQNQETKEIERVYKGEGSIQFTCYYPYGHTPTKLFRNKGTAANPVWEYSNITDGRLLSAYDEQFYTTKDQWKTASGLYESAVPNCINRGDVPAPFVFTISTLPINKTLSVGPFSIVIHEDCSNIIWDSRTGIVKGQVGDTVRPVSYSGNGCVALPVSSTAGAVTSGGKLSYHFWYY